MRLSLRFVIPLLLALGAFAYVAVPLADALMLRWFVRDLDMRSSLIASTVQEPLSGLILTGLDAADRQLLQPDAAGRAALRRRALPRRAEAAPIATSQFPPEIRCASLDAYADDRRARAALAARRAARRRAPRRQRVTPDARLVLVHDMSFVERRSEETRRYLFYFFIALGACIALITVVIAQLSWRGWVQGLRALLRGEGILRPAAIQHGARAAPDRARPARADPRSRAPVPAARRQPAHLGPAGAARDAAQRIARQRRDRRLQPRALHPRAHAGGHPRPAPGERTRHRARAGDARLLGHLDRARQRHRRPRDRRPPRPRRGAARSIRSTRSGASGSRRRRSAATTAASPTRACGRCATSRTCARRSAPRDFEHYRHVNARFADAVVAEAKTKDPIVLVQDYHFALLPRMIRDRLPDATIITFWHIPWPNPEAFAICPWRIELLDGLLGSSILGFHTQFHCNNFLDTVDRLLEARVDRESFTIAFRGAVDGGAPLSDLDRVAARVAGHGEERPRRAARGARAARPAARPPARRRHRSPRLHEGHPRALQRGARACSSSSRAGSAASRSCRSPRRPAARSTTIATTRRACARSPTRSTRATPTPKYPADRPARRAPRARCRLRVPSRRRPLLRQQPARRDEPGREGVRRGARRRAGRADPVAVRRARRANCRRRWSSIPTMPTSARRRCSSR